MTPEDRKRLHEGADLLGEGWDWDMPEPERFSVLKCCALILAVMAFLALGIVGAVAQNFDPLYTGEEESLNTMHACENKEAATLVLERQQEGDYKRALSLFNEYIGYGICFVIHDAVVIPLKQVAVYEMSDENGTWKVYVHEITSTVFPDRRDYLITERPLGQGV